MNLHELSKLAGSARCRVIGWGEAGNDGHRRVLGALIRAFDRSESALLCEASLARRTNHPPDIVLIDARIGVHTFEVKAMPLGQIEELAAGGHLTIRYASGVKNANPIAQVRTAMFDIKDATVRAFEADVQLPFKYWVAFPSITRQQWIARFGEAAYRPDEFLFAEDLEPTQLAARLGASSRHDSNEPIKLCPLAQLECVWKAFGDTSVLYATPEDRQPRRVEEGTLGEQFDEAAEAYKALSDEQQRLSVLNWEDGPRLVRGVAGSGKTVVLANNLARRLQRTLAARNEGLFGDKPLAPRFLAVCFNRTLAPFIEKKIAIAYQQRTGEAVPKGAVEVCSFNTLMHRLMEAGLWRYQTIGSASDIVRAMRYTEELEDFRQQNPGKLLKLAYDAIYVDEGQDFAEEEFGLLKGLCRVTDGGEPSLYVFYDDAQNLYGRKRPNWQSVGLNIRGGRAFVMTQCFRNTRPIVEATFNVLYGSCAQFKGPVPTKDFGDIATLEQKGLIAHEDGLWRVGFAVRDGRAPVLSLTNSPRKETESIITRLRWLLGQQEVRPQDILILTYTKERARELADALSGARLPGINDIHVAMDKKDESLGQRNRLTVSTVHSAKGYDAYCVLLASANDFSLDVAGRASFYVGCTRAIEYLEVFACENTGLVRELGDVLKKISARPSAPTTSRQPILK